MALKTKLTKAEYEKLSDGVKEHYKVDGDGYKLDADYEDVGGLKSTLEKKKADLEALKAEVAKFKDIDPDKAREALAAIAKADEQKAKDAGEFDRLIAKAKKEADDAIAKIKGDLAVANAELIKHRLTGPVKDAAIKAGILPKMLDSVVQLNLGRFKLSDKGENKILVLDSDGDPTGKSLDDYWSKDYKDAMPEFYAATGNGGSGSKGSNSGGGGGAGKTYSSKEYRDLLTSNPAAAAVITKEVNAKTATLTD